MDEQQYGPGWVPQGVLNQEAEDRERRRLIEKVLFSRDERKTFENFDCNFNNQKKNVDDVLNFLSDPSTRKLLLCGFVGRGKTHLAQACANKWVSMGQQAIVISAHRLYLVFKELAQYDPDPVDEKAMNRIWESSLLVIDDLGGENQTEKQVFNRNFQALLDEYRGKLIITTNLPNQKRENIYGQRIASRLYEDSLIIVLEGNDYRKEKGGVW
jgi:DNA replication protein DnaC